MRTNDFDYFTTWSLIAIVLALTALKIGKLAHRPQPWLGVFVICLALVVCVLGTDAVSYHLDPPAVYRKTLMRNHMWMHLVPFVVSLILLTNWDFYIGHRVSARSGGFGFAAALALFGTWLFLPLDSGERGLSKISTVYNTQNPATFLLSGGALGIAGAFLAYQASNHAATRCNSGPFRTCTQ